MMIDTSGMLAVADPNEPTHAWASAQYAGAARRVIHNYVLAEWVPLAHTRGLPRATALQFMDEVLAEPGLELIWVDPDIHDDAVALLLARSDKTYSLCDAVSFVIMDRLDLTDALTTDKHFMQEGFVRLLG